MFDSHGSVDSVPGEDLMVTKVTIVAFVQVIDARLSTPEFKSSRERNNVSVWPH